MRSSSLTSRLLQNLYEEHCTVKPTQASSSRLTLAATCSFQININCNSTAKYRSYNGTCNNLQTPILGSINTPYTRVLPPAYGDGTNSPRSLSLVSGKLLSNPRTISLSLSVPTSGQILVNNGLSQLYAQFGQFLTHDLLGTSITADSNGNELYCPCGSTDSNCISFNIPSPDLYLGLFCTDGPTPGPAPGPAPPPRSGHGRQNGYGCQGGGGPPPCNTGKVSSQTCIKQTRSSATFAAFNCSTSYREQLNLLSAYIDGSGIYGINATRASFLRSFTGGLLKTSPGLTGTSILVRGNLKESLTGRTDKMFWFALVK